MRPLSTINSETTHGNLGLERALRSLEGGNVVDPTGGFTYVCMKTSNDNYDHYVDSYQAQYPNGNYRVQSNFSTALALMTHNDTVILTQGDWTGDHTTPLNAVAAFCKVFGMPGSWMAPTSASTPCIDVMARGWRFSGIEFDNSTTAAGLRMNKNAGLTQRGADFFEVDNCLFYGGQGGIEFNGGGTYWNIHDNQFSLISTSGKAGIWVQSSSYQLPALGKIHNNHFDNNINHVHVNAKGFNDVSVHGNRFMQDGNGQNATVLLDIEGSGGGNMVTNNYFDCTVAEYEADANAYVQGNATDSGSGNMCSDGIPGYDGTASVFGA